MSLLLLPLTSTFLICYFLPRANKLVTQFQGTPNAETIKMQLTAKIEIGEQQQQLAEIEARKELAKVKVEKEIDKSIDMTIEMNETLQDKVTMLELEINEARESINEITISRDTLLNTRETDKEALNSLKKEINEEKNERKETNSKLNEALLRVGELQQTIKNLTNEKDDLKKILSKTDDIKLSILLECFPKIFKLGDDNKNIQIMSEAIEKITTLNDGSWFYELQQPSNQNQSRVDLLDLKNYVEKFRDKLNQ